MPPWAQLDIVRTVHRRRQASAVPEAALRQAGPGGGDRPPGGKRGVKLAVNQQLRWGQGLRAARTLIRKGWIGAGRPTPRSRSASTRRGTCGRGWRRSSGWRSSTTASTTSTPSARSSATRSGSPAGTAARRCRATCVGETKTITILDYSDVQRSGDFQYIAPNMQAFVADNHYNQSDDYFAVFRFIGTDGVITGTLGRDVQLPGRPARHAGVEQPAPLPRQALRGQAGRQVDPRLVHRADRLVDAGHPGRRRARDRRLRQPADAPRRGGAAISRPPSIARSTWASARRSRVGTEKAADDWKLDAIGEPILRLRSRSFQSPICIDRSISVEQRLCGQGRHRDRRRAGDRQRGSRSGWRARARNVVIAEYNAAKRGRCSARRSRRRAARRWPTGSTSPTSRRCSGWWTTSPRSSATSTSWSTTPASCRPSRCWI